MHQALRTAPPLPHVSAEFRVNKLCREDIAEQDRPTSGGAAEGVAQNADPVRSSQAIQGLPLGVGAMQVSTAALPAFLHRRPVPKRQRRGLGQGRSELEVRQTPTFSKPRLESLQLSACYL